MEASQAACWNVSDRHGSHNRKKSATNTKRKHKNRKPKNPASLPAKKERSLERQLSSKRCEVQDVDDEMSSASSSEEEKAASILKVESDDDSQPSDEEINVEFEAQALCEEDFHGVCQLLKQCYVTSGINVSELTDILLSQKDVGSTIKVVDDDEGVVYGVSSVVSLAEHKEKGCIQQLKDFLLRSCRREDVALEKQLAKVLCSEGVGLLINERFINIPSAIALPLYKTLRSEIACHADKDPFFQFKHLVLVCKSLKYPVESRGHAKKQKKKKSPAGSDNDQLIFVNSEDEVFVQNALLTFSYSVTEAIGNALGGDWSSEETLDTYRTVVVLKNSGFDAVMQSLTEQLDTS